MSLQPDGTPAPHDGKGNPTININVKLKTCVARDQEDAPRGGFVNFHVSEDMTMHFGDQSVFGTRSRPLSKGDNNVSVTPTKGDTTYSDDPNVTRGDPHIIVP